jgi:hypothetical protein
VRRNERKIALLYDRFTTAALSILPRSLPYLAMIILEATQVVSIAPSSLLQYI